MKLKATNAVIVLLVSMIFCVSAWAQYVPEVVALKGNPKIMKRGADAWVSCSVGFSVHNGDRIKTAAGETVDIGFVEDRVNVLRLGGESELVVINGQAPYVVELVKGDVMASIPSLPEESSFEVWTAVGISGAKGTGWKSWTDGTRSVFEAYENTIYVKSIGPDGRPVDEDFFVDMGYRTTIEKLGNPTEVVRLLPEDFDAWNAWTSEVKKRLMEEPPVVVQDRVVASGTEEEAPAKNDASQQQTGVEKAAQKAMAEKAPSEKDLQQTESAFKAKYEKGMQ